MEDVPGAGRSCSRSCFARPRCRRTGPGSIPLLAGVAMTTAVRRGRRAWTCAASGRTTCCSATEGRWHPHGVVASSTERLEYVVVGIGVNLGSSGGVDGGGRDGRRRGVAMLLRAFLRSVRRRVRRRTSRGRRRDRGRPIRDERHARPRGRGGEHGSSDMRAAERSPSTSAGARASTRGNGTGTDHVRRGDTISDEAGRRRLLRSSRAVPSAHAVPETTPGARRGARARPPPSLDRAVPAVARDDRGRDPRVLADLQVRRGRELGGPAWRWRSC